MILLLTLRFFEQSMAAVRAGGARGSSSHRQASAGKHPMRRLASSSSMRSSTESNKDNGASSAKKTDCHISDAKMMKKAATSVSSRHRMITRSKAGMFRLLDLPPEIRNRIYSHTVAQDSMSLEKIKLPPVLSVCRQIRTEALPIFFSTNTFTCSVRSNWCVFARHFHSVIHKHFEESGQIDMSPLLLGLGELKMVVSHLSANAVRFRQVEYQINCCCCIKPRKIATLKLFVDGRRPDLAFDPNTSKGHTVESLVLIFEHVNKFVESLGKREVFNGFTVEDIVRVARFFRYQGHQVDGTTP